MYIFPKQNKKLPQILAFIISVLIKINESECLKYTTITMSLIF